MIPELLRAALSLWFLGWAFAIVLGRGSPYAQKTRQSLLSPVRRVLSGVGRTARSLAASLLRLIADW